MKCVDDQYVIYENRTEQCIETFKTKNNAKNFMKRLNSGCGFAGWTPPFFVESKNALNNFLSREM